MTAFLLDESWNEGGEESQKENSRCLIIEYVVLTSETKQINVDYKDSDFIIHNHIDIGDNDCETTPKGSHTIINNPKLVKDTVGTLVHWVEELRLGRNIEVVHCLNKPQPYVRMFKLTQWIFLTTKLYQTQWHHPALLGDSWLHKSTPTSQPDMAIPWPSSEEEMNLHSGSALRTSK